MIFNINNKVFFAFSDTHGNHHRLQVPEDADVVICAGDAVEDDLKGGEYDDFIDWFAGLPAKWKIFVSGNHELSFELDQAEEIEKAMTDKGILVMQNAVMDCDGVVICSINGNALIADEDIPTDIDVLVTHCPPYGVLDEGLGSPEILNFVLKSKPKYHLFGHIHATEGQEFQFGDTLCKNVSSYLPVVVPRLAGPAGKFLPGIRRWLREGDITLSCEQDYERMNIFLHIMEDHPAFFFFDEDFNGQSREFVESSLNVDMNADAYVAPENITYRAVRIDSYEQAFSYFDYAPDWCIIISEYAYQEYSRNGADTFFFLERSDMRNVPRRPGKNFPKDDYGLSLIAVCVTADGTVASITSRWNYGDQQDFFLTTEELKSIVGADIFVQLCPK